jgi:predicted nucleotidyltransferase component of viral defense system
MAKEILTPLQKNFIKLFSRNKNLNKRFYLSGGTALAAYYLKHRYSEDLDFFSFSEVDTSEINAFLKNIKNCLDITKIDFQLSFNRNIFFLHSKNGVLKTEFTYFPFERIEKPLKRDGISIDSLIDIATNKAFTIFQNPRARDFIDLYIIFRDYKTINFPLLLKNSRSKFDSAIDPLQLGAQLLKAKSIRDLPQMLVKIDHSDWRAYFINQAKALSDKILA